MFDVAKVIKVDICTNSGNILQSLKKGFNFPRIHDSDNKMVRLLIIKGNNLPLYSRGTPVIVVVNMKSGDRFSYSSVVTVSTSGQLNIGIYLDKQVVLEDRRRYFKVECDLPCKIIGLLRSNQRYEFEPLVDGQILNINIGGVFLATVGEPVFHLGDALSVIIPSLNKAGSDYVLNVLRAQAASDGNFMGYGCQFLGLDAKREEYIGQVINQIQVEKRRQEKYTTSAE